MKLSVSNLALPADLDPDWGALRELGVKGIEVAPTRIATWDALTPQHLSRFRATLGRYDLVVSSLQAIFYGKPDIALLQEAAAFNRMAEHLKKVGEIGAILGASVVVLGAPKQRARGELSEEEAFELGAERLQILAQTIGESGLTIGLEPVPAAYNGDFLPTWQHAAAMVRRVNHPALRLHLDTGCVHLGGGDVAEAIKSTNDILVHFHVAEPMLTGFDAPQAPHKKAALALYESGYNQWVAIEMLEQKTAAMDALVNAIKFTTSRYFDGANRDWQSLQ